MKKIAFHIQKGGTGKTTLSGNVAYYASKTLKTVLVDADPQGNSTSWYITGSIDYELADVLRGAAEVKDSLVPIEDNFSILGSAALGGQLKDYAETKLFQEPFVFDDLNKELEQLGVQLVIYDLSPGMSMLERCVILSCNEVITPLTPEYFSMDGLEAFTMMVKDINKAYRKNVQHNKLVINNLNRSFRKHRDSLELFKKLDLQLFVVPQDRGIAESQFNHQSLWQYDAGSRAVPDLEKLTAALVV